jgi:hypothetical protein
MPPAGSSEPGCQEAIPEDYGISQLAARYPLVPVVELKRFYKARGCLLDDAAAMYEAHLEWRRTQGAPQRMADASRAVPQKYVRCTGTARDGSPLILIQGARYALDIQPEEYVLACAQLLDSVLPPTDARKATVLIDVRPVEGWPNVPATKMVPFFTQAASILSANFPERAKRIIVYPMPSFVRSLWWLVSGLLDPETKDKFVILSGAADVGSPCPEELREFVALDQLPADAHAMHAELACPVTSDPAN